MRHGGLLVHVVAEHEAGHGARGRRQEEGARPAAAGAPDRGEGEGEKEQDQEGAGAAGHVGDDGEAAGGDQAGGAAARGAAGGQGQEAGQLQQGAVQEGVQGPDVGRPVPAAGAK